MTPEELKLYEHPGMQAKFREIMGEWRKDDRWYHPASDETGTCQIGLTTDLWPALIVPCNVVRLPLPIDPDDYERKKRGEKPRGLWGMVDWDKLSDKFISPDGQFLVMKRRGEELHNIVATPPLALLKALEHQWGKES